MRVLHINSYYAAGGRPTFYKHFYETLIAKGVETEVFVPVPREMQTAPEQEFGRYSHVVKTHNNRDRYFFFPKQKKITEEAKKRFADSSFDVIHAHSLFTNGYVANKLHHCFGIPYIVAVRNTDINVFFRYMPYLRSLGYKILLDAERVVFMNEPYRNNLVEKTLPEAYKEKIRGKAVVLPNGIDRFWLENRYSGKRSTPRRTLHLLTVGQLSKNKNQIIVVQASELLISRGFNVRYTIIGEVKDTAIFNKIKKHEFVEYIPPLTKEELLPYYCKADVFVLPSKTETFGLVYAEAMTQSLPVIYTRGQGFDRQFEEGTVGYHVDYRKPEEIADRIQDIVFNYGSIAQNCISLSGKYDWRIITKRYVEVYNKCISDRECALL